MRALRRLMLAASCSLVLVAPGTTACSSDGDGGSGPSPALIGTWDATSFIVGGNDAIQAGMSLVMTLDANGGYTFDYTNDQIGACNPGPDCSDSGDYSSTSTKITFDPGTADEVTLNWSVNGTTLTATGSVGGMAVTATFEKQ